MSKQNEILPLSALLGQSKQDQYISTSEQSYKHHDVFIDTEIGEPSEYRELISTLFNASSEDTINIFINSGGGNLDTALAIVEGLKNTSAEVTAVIIGACHSAASIISMYCDRVAVLDNAYSMVHTASFGTVGNTGNVKSYTDFTVRQVERLLHETYEGFLTKDELAKVKDGVELWFDSEDMRRRMNNRIKLLETKIKKQAKENRDE